MLQICKNIRLARESRGYSQTKMADLLDVSRTTYRNWEENTEPELTIIKSIAKALEVEPYTLLKDIIDFVEIKKPDEKSGNQTVTISLHLTGKQEEIQTITESLNKILSTVSLSQPSAASTEQAKQELDQNGRTGSFSLPTEAKQ